MSDTIGIGSVDICCPHCGMEDTYWHLDATTCVEGTSVSWKPVEGENAVMCENCKKLFFATAHVNIDVREL